MGRRGLKRAYVTLTAGERKTGSAVKNKNIERPASSRSPTCSESFQEEDGLALYNNRDPVYFNFKFDQKSYGRS